MLLIRKAAPGDALELAQVAERTFRETFGAQNTAENMELHCQASYGEAIQSREILAPDMATILAVDEGKLIGFAQLRWDGAPNCVLSTVPGEIQRLYVMKAWQGKGVAPVLLEACMTEMKVRGVNVVWLGVWERNPRAISFYGKNGFTEAGAHEFRLGCDPQRDIVMIRPVAAQ
jgi:ribosomal protein S18 acetylase RimI-like enzyme